jgi:hypothetical protein
MMVPPSPRRIRCVSAAPAAAKIMTQLGNACACRVESRGDIIGNANGLAGGN